MARFVRRRLKEGAHVFDVGCGAGAQSAWLYLEGFDVFAVDVSPTAIERAVLRINGIGNPKGGRFGAAVADITKDTFAIADSDAFDAAIDVCCLQHIVQPDRLSKAFSEIRRVLKPGGWLFSVLASNRHAQIAFGGMEARTYGMAQAVALFKHAGFNIVTVHSKEHTDDFFWARVGNKDVPTTGTVAHWLIEAVKKDA